MNSNQFSRQSFLGANSQNTLRDCSVGLIGLGGGGSHVAQQLGHIGVGKFLLIDPDIVEDHNLNRLVGAVFDDVGNATPKVEVARRVIASVNSEANIVSVQLPWQERPELLRDCDVIFGSLDRYAARDELERLSRRFLIPYLDMGMDVHALGNHYLISGQVALSLPGGPCLWCMGLLSQKLLTEEAQRYGQAGGRPQVVWPNGVLASVTVGLFMQLVTPWHQHERLPVLLEYDGNAHTVLPSNKVLVFKGRQCRHYLPADIGDPFFTSPEN